MSDDKDGSGLNSRLSLSLETAGAVGGAGLATATAVAVGDAGGVDDGASASTSTSPSGGGSTSLVRRAKLDRLSGGLRDLRDEVLARRNQRQQLQGQGHERERSCGSAKGILASSGQVSPIRHRFFPLPAPLETSPLLIPKQKYRVALPDGRATCDVRRIALRSLPRQKSPDLLSTAEAAAAAAAAPAAPAVLAAPHAMMTPAASTSRTTTLPFSRASTAESDPRSPADTLATLSSVGSTSTSIKSGSAAGSSGSNSMHYSGASGTDTSTASTASTAPTSAAGASVSDSQTLTSPSDLGRRTPQPGSATSSGSASSSNANVTYASSLSSKTATSTSASASSRKLPNTFVLVTQDHEQLSRVDLSGLKSPEAIRERLYTRAQVLDDDFHHCSVHLSSLETVEPGPALSDDELWRLSEAILRGELVPAPLFFINVAFPNSNPASQPNTGSGAPSPGLPPSPYAFARAQSPISPRLHADPLETSSNSSGTGLRRQPPSAQQRTSPSLDKLASPRTRLLYSPPPPPEDARDRTTQLDYLDHEKDKRSSASSSSAGYHQDRLRSLPNNGESGTYDSAQHVWDGRSNNGQSENENDFLRAHVHQQQSDKSKLQRRRERQARSEAVPSRSAWQAETPLELLSPRQMFLPGQSAPPALLAKEPSSADMRPGGYGPSGPIFLPVHSPQLASHHQAGRPRANSATAWQNSDRSGTPNHQAFAPRARPGQPAGYGPSGPLHFPQLSQHAMSVPSSRPFYAPQQMYEQSRSPQQQSYPQGYLQPSVDFPKPPQQHTMRKKSAKSMDNLRSAGATSAQPPPMIPPGGMVPGQVIRIPNGRSPFQSPSILYEDPRHSHGLAVRASTSDLDMPQPLSQQAVHRPSQPSPHLSPPIIAKPRLPPTNSAPRIPSYPPYPQRPLNQLGPGHSSLGPILQRPTPQSTRIPPQRGPGFPLPDRRPSSEYMGLPQSRIVAPLQQVAGPQRIPLQPGETLQEMFSGNMGHVVPIQSRPETSPQFSRSPDRDHSPRIKQVPFDRHPLPQQHIRAVSYEDRPRSGLAGNPVEHQPIHSGQSQHLQYIETRHFAQSPPNQAMDIMPLNRSPHAGPADRLHNVYVPHQGHPPQSMSVFESQPSNRSSASVEEQKSPVSSRPSTSGLDRAVDRPGSYPSSSTNESTTPVTDPGASGAPLRSPSTEAKPTLLEKTRPEVVAQDDVYQGVELLHDQIDAATARTPVPDGQEPSQLESIDETSDTIKGQEWASLFNDWSNTGHQNQIDEIKQAGAESEMSTSGAITSREDDEESTIGKDERRLTPLERSPATSADKTAVNPIAAPTPIFAYNPDEDEDEDVMTWAVKMEPTKPATGGGVQAAIPFPSDSDTASNRLSTPMQDGESTSPLASPRQDRPSLRVQTDALAANGAPQVASNAPKQPVIQSVITSADADKRSPSPRSSGRRARQVSANFDPFGLKPGSAGAVHNGRSSHAGHLTPQEIERRASFKNNAWAFRPPVEQVYENLEDFFPNHDLDKPIVDASAGAPHSAISSPDHDVITRQTSPSDTKHVHDADHTSGANTPPHNLHHHHPHSSVSDNHKRFNPNRKSMRMVAQDRKSRLKKEETTVKAFHPGILEKEAKLARRKSTKVWGKKVEEVTAAEVDRLQYGKLDSPGKDEGSVKWVKGELIGKGTYGHVYIGFNVTNGEMIAVKQVELPRTANDKDDSRQLGVVEALKSEMELLKDLEHEKIVSYLGFEETPAHLSIFLEYVPGGSVGRCLRKHGKFETEVIQFFTTQILEGLEYLHKRGILHRDLKADNILVKMDGTIKISDFGISKKSSDIYNNNSNMSMQGSIFWMAPEVVSNQKKGYSAKIDIWSLGCVVLEMFAGRRPWDSEEAIQAMFKLGAERLAPPVPKDVILTNQSSHFLKECFHGDPDKRPTASRLLCHKFLTLDKGWDFHMSALHKAMKCLI